MAFEPPVIAPSGATFADLRSGGLRGVVDQIIEVNPRLTLEDRELIKQSTSGPACLRHLSAQVDQWVAGAAIPSEDIERVVAGSARQIAVIAAAVHEIAAIVHGHPGQLGEVHDKTPRGRNLKRTFNT